MADGSRQQGFTFPKKLPVSHLRPGEIVVDLFAGGGGASTGLEQALGRPVDIAVNHSPVAIGMHAVNHPLTRHACEDVYDVDPLAECADLAVGWVHASPDCTHHSQARGGQPRDRAIRALSWVLVKWAGKLKKRARGGAPRILSLENVEQILKWGPLVAKRDKATGRVITLDMVEEPGSGRMVNRIAAPGERVPIERQFLVPDPKRQGQTWHRFVAMLERLGYVVEHRKLKASDFGAGTSRTRLFMLARCDGEKPRWPKPSHGRAPGLEPVVCAADCIDWSVPCPSIFTRKKPLADATHRRIARGIRRFVIEAAEPFIVQCANATSNGVHAATDPLGTVTAWPKGGAHAVVAPTLVQTGYGEREGQAPRSLDLGEPLGVTPAGGVKHAVVSAVLTGVGGRAGDTEPRAVTEPGYTATGKADCALASAHLVKFRGDSPGTAATEPVDTITSGGATKRPAGAAHAMGVVTAYLEQAAGGPNSNGSRPRAATEEVSTISTKGSQQQLVSAHLMYAATSNTNGGRGDPTQPLRTVMAGGQHHAVVECTLSQEHLEGAERVAAFLMRYYGTGGQHGHLSEPLATVTTKDRLALVTVWVKGDPYVIVDIGLRMLRPRELYTAQGFERDYIIDRTADGRTLTQAESVRLVGNSVSPKPMRALARENLDREPMQA